ncbi:methyltransferase domain protein [Dictyocaulus viviparus]|uniref:mRNA (guanine-N(7))-methyltransferase n=1 Tax=Dictyocaulus viviparus TaxID=29172 RepID=A0A0D8XH44_DICVI|nr:methyltransferase domain protein [Dictyocaulus viviparus]
MSSGFVTSSELEELRKKRQEEWEKVRKPNDPIAAPEPETCTKSLYEQLRDNKEAKQAEIDEARRFKNLIRGIDEDESDFLARVSELKAAEIRKAKKEEEEALREAAIARNQQSLIDPPTVSQLKVLPKEDRPPISKQAAILSSAIKRKSTSNNDDNATEKLSRLDENRRACQTNCQQPTMTAMRIIGSIPGIGTYEASRYILPQLAKLILTLIQCKLSSDSASSDSDDEEDPYIPVLQTTVPQKKAEVLHLLRKESDNKYFRPRVLDLACGKGGDLRKWRIANVKSVVMTDVAQVSLNQAKERYDEMAQRERFNLFSAEFIHADCCKISTTQKFDLVSCQFALHYSFIDEQSARTFLLNATETLRPGGYFIGTLPDAERIVWERGLFYVEKNSDGLICRKFPYNDKLNSYQINNRLLGRWSARQNNGEFRNSVCSIQYEDKEELNKPPLFGAKFHFSLDSQVDCPEFLAYFPLLKQWSARQNNGEFRNSVCSIQYEDKEELNKPPLFGAKFHFSLDSQVDCPEFLAYFPLLKQWQYRLKLVEQTFKVA